MIVDPESVGYAVAASLEGGDHAVIISAPFVRLMEGHPQEFSTGF
jgi:hypothetical protein